MAVPFIAPLDLRCLNSNHNSDQDSNSDEDDDEKQTDKNYDIARNSDLSSRHSKNTVQIESKNKKNLATFEGSDSLKRKKWKELEIFPRQKKEHKQKQSARIVAKTLQNYSER